MTNRFFEGKNSLMEENETFNLEKVFLFVYQKNNLT